MKKNLRKKHRIPGESPAANPQAGVALLLAVVFIALLSAMVFSFLYEMEVDAVFVQNQGADFQARVAANSAVVNGMMVLAEQYASMLESGMPPVDSEVDGSQWHLGAAFEPLNEATMRTSIADEFGKINLNALLVYENGQPTRNDPLVNALREFFLLRDDSGYDPVDAIIDWLDYNDGDAEEPEGAESEFYQGLENPYSCKNGPMTSIEELLLIRGITPELYFGDPEQEQEPLSEYLTVHGDWRGRVNVNTAKVEVIAAILAGQANNPDLGAAEQIYEEARMAPIDNASQLRQFVPEQPVDTSSDILDTERRPRNAGGNMDQLRRLQQRQQRESIEGMFRFNSNTFRIYGDGMAEDTQVRVEAYVFRQPYDPRDMEEEMSRLGTLEQQEFVDMPQQLFRILEWKIVQ
ncbi:MAG: General secretion pathway protein K [Candidatus Hydrogenedentes bacterium ADurb.Bin101]|nr:MAG: General secretion pathway protein K [Candidatus Hydrogenedentes bacterium ADurb.Bin101]